MRFFGGVYTGQEDAQGAPFQPVLRLLATRYGGLTAFMGLVDTRGCGQWSEQGAQGSSLWEGADHKGLWCLGLFMGRTHKGLCLASDGGEA